MFLTFVKAEGKKIYIFNRVIGRRGKEKCKKDNVGAEIQNSSILGLGLVRAQINKY